MAIQIYIYKTSRPHYGGITYKFYCYKSSIISSYLDKLLKRKKCSGMVSV